jgi:hypothetical protein
MIDEHDIARRFAKRESEGVDKIDSRIRAQGDSDRYDSTLSTRLNPNYRTIDSPEFLWPCSIICAFPVTGSQNWTPRSFEPLMTHWPSGVRHTLSTKSYSMQ